MVNHFGWIQGMLEIDWMLEIDFETHVHLHTVVFHLHGAVFLALIVAERLVEKVVSVGIDCVFRFLSPRVAGVEVKVVHLVVIAVELAAGAHFVDECRGEVV